MSQFTSALTIDVEDGINISMRDNFKVEMEPTGRVVDNVEVILDICEKNGVKGTFFILGEVAEKYPELVKKVYKAGHEIGVHGYQHDQVFRLTPDTLRDALTKAKGLIENLIGQEVFGFRAPAFSVNPKTSWALPVIASCGFKYDSSIFPSLSLRYGWKDFSRQICRIRLDNSTSLVEVPLSVINVLGRDLPVGGGGYLRYFPYSWTRKALSSITRERPAIVYLHPYELDPRRYPDYFHDAIARAPLKKRIYLSLYRYKKVTVMPKLDQVTREFRFAPLHEIIRDLDREDKISDIRI
ncbi:MAG: polysaccharide deacetylase family protein [Bacteroidota bacterium]|nr:polysaccharide deacetylase family protein [Bacteroidota bacterium]